MLPWTGAFVHDLAVGEAQRARAREVLRERLQAAGENAPGARPLVVLAPFTTRPQKHWVEANWSELGRQMLARGLQPVVLGGPADREAAERICAGQPQLLNLAGALKLDESVALIADGFGIHVPKGYIYAAMAFSAFVEFLNLISRERKTRKAGAEPSAH